MSVSRRARLLRLLVDGVVDFELKHICRVIVTETATSGAGVLVMADDRVSGSLCTTDATSATLEDLQFSLGEGPGVDALETGRPVLVADLAAPGEDRWPAFRGAAIDAGAAALFCFPLRLGSVRLGSLDLYRRSAGPLSDERHGDALVMADIITRAVLVVQADAPPGALAAELAAGADLRLVVHQATGMVAAQMGVHVGEAFVRLRAHAFACGRALDDVSTDVVGRRLRFAADGDSIEVEG